MADTHEHRTSRETERSGRDARNEDLYLGDPEYLISAVFDKFRKAEQAAAELLAEGFPEERISVLLSEETRREYLEIHKDLDAEGHVLAQTVVLDEESKTMEGAGVGGTIGGTIGAAAGALLAGTAVAIPPLGVVVAGPLAAALTGAGAGGIAGGLIGALTGAGMTEFRARQFERFIRDGDVIVSARALTDPERNEITRILDAHGGERLRADDLED